MTTDQKRILGVTLNLAYALMLMPLLLPLYLLAAIGRSAHGLFFLLLGPCLWTWKKIYKQ